MIEAVERLCSEEEIAQSETFRWEGLKESLRRVINQLDDSRSDSVRETHDELTPEYDKLESMLEEISEYIDGRIEELTPGSYKDDLTLHHYVSKGDIEALNYALQEGVNAVALSRIYPSTRKMDAIEYIREHGLSSLNYEASCAAVRAYEAQRGAIRWA